MTDEVIAELEAESSELEELIIYLQQQKKEVDRELLLEKLLRRLKDDKQNNKID